ncbi:DUF106 domain-containing protein [Candidatus Woesearchaeota archaeon]|nr:MAG: hypothetical protein QS99_C0002G0047 [archaeon GW2011_AR4]MBS3129168.1 DUF106 domain-containing protein [Candidatus Woesearchaeota archaeon]HIH37901.1 DUF106 domain-containing protein [Candidatus Woesearchaeota archaeon]HIH48890.1 DUF106 domain-containing protein [Candidatus Woesearchaeota archaeon]HIJ04028.1 DUF106 domain-containing protein [Candidatus Woesearchaeota archaeon]
MVVIIDWLFSPLLKISPILAIILVSFLVSVLITYVYKWMTDQKLMKELRDKMKDDQKRMREHRDNPKKLMEIQKSAMEANMKYMSHSMKPTFVTFIPIILIFAWLGGHLAYEPILPDQEFSVTIAFKDQVLPVEFNPPPGIDVIQNFTEEGKNAVMKGKGKEGEYILDFGIADKTYSHDLIITQGKEYAKPSEIVKDKTVQTITINNKNTVMFMIGKKTFGWLGTYIIFSLVFSMALRKILNLA